MTRVKAKYNKAILPEHQGNPFIEALPEKISSDDLIKFFGNYPECEEHERLLSPMIREEYTIRIKSLRQPLKIYVDCFRAIESVIKEGYSTKNPLVQQQLNIFTIQFDEKPEIAPNTGYFQPKGHGLT